MITYPRETYLQEFREHMLAHTEGMPHYVENGVVTTAVNYHNAVPQSYAIDATLIFDPETNPEAHEHVPSPLTEAMIVQRAGGHGEIGTWNGVTGYIGERGDPATPDMQPHPNDGFDTIAFTLGQELEEECTLDSGFIREIDFRAGEWHDFPRSEPSYPEGAYIRVVPVIGRCATKPEITPKLDEISAYAWVKLSKLKDVPMLDKGYFEKTLPAALETLGLGTDHVHKMLGMK